MVLVLVVAMLFWMSVSMSSSSSSHETGTGELGRGSDRPDRELAGVVSREIRGLMPPLTAALSSSLSSFST